MRSIVAAGVLCASPALAQDGAGVGLGSLGSGPGSGFDSAPAAGSPARSGSSLGLSSTGRGEWQSFTEANTRRRMGYLRVSGLAVAPQEDARLLTGGGTGMSSLTGERVGLDDSFGMTFAVGLHVPDRPLSLEVEYAFRRFATEDYPEPGAGVRDTEFYSHTLALNGLLDAPDLLGPVGVYGGGGIGVRMSSLSHESGGGTSSTEIEGNEFFWQFMAGATVSMGDRTQLYGGVRWSDAGDVEDDAVRLDLESVDLEIGIRFFF